MRNRAGARVIGLRQCPDDQRRLLRVEEIGVRKVRKILAIIAARVFPSAPHVDEPIGFEDPNSAVGFVGVATRFEIAEERRGGGGKRGVIVHLEWRGARLVVPKRDFNLVDAVDSQRGKIGFEVFLPAVPLSELGQSASVHRIEPWHCLSAR